MKQEFADNWARRNVFSFKFGQLHNFLWMSGVTERKENRSASILVHDIDGGIEREYILSFVADEERQLM